MLIPQEREKHLLFLVENKKSRSLVPITAKSSSGDRHLAPLGMTPSGAIFHHPASWGYGQL
jgi:hypothetical protein